MLSEVYIDFCFMREPSAGDFESDLEHELSQLFPKTIHWYMDVKGGVEFDMIVAELRGMARWQSEEEVVTHIEEYGSDQLWNWLKGMQLNVYPVMKGCGSCG